MCLFWGTANGGEQNLSCDLSRGEAYYRAQPPKPVLEGSERGIGLVCARSLKGKMAGREQSGGEGSAS